MLPLIQRTSWVHPSTKFHRNHSGWFCTIMLTKQAEVRLGTRAVLHVTVRSGRPSYRPAQLSLFSPSADCFVLLLPSPRSFPQSSSLARQAPSEARLSVQKWNSRRKRQVAANSHEKAWRRISCAPQLKMSFLSLCLFEWNSLNCWYYRDLQPLVIAEF